MYSQNIFTFVFLFLFGNQFFEKYTINHKVEIQEKAKRYIKRKGKNMSNKKGQTIKGI